MHERDEAELVNHMEGERFLDDLRPVRNVSKKTPRAVYSIRLTLDEAQEFEAAARERGITLSDFLRLAARASILADKDSAIGELRTKIRELSETASRL